MSANGQPSSLYRAGRCAERACAFPSTGASPKGYCKQHSLMFEGGWPIRPHTERNVTAAGIGLDRPGNITRHQKRPAHA